MNYEQRISNETFNANLKSFAAGVANNFYQPIPKDEWRVLKEIKAPIIVINYTNNHDIWISDKSKYLPQFTKNDKSLGQYFYETYFKSQEMRDGNMTWTTSSSTGDCLTYDSGSLVWNSNPLNATTTSGTSVSGNSYTYTIPNTNVYTTTNAWVDVSTSKDVKKLEEDIKKLQKEVFGEEEKNTMSDMINFDFGKVPAEKFAVSPYGIAVKTANGGWVAYDAEKNEVIDAKIFHVDADGLFYKIPTPIDKIKIGDIIIHQGKPMFVQALNNTNTITAVNYNDASLVTILPIKSPFGFNFITKVISLVDFNKLTANKDKPFGNILPFLLLKDKKIDPMVLMMMNNQDMNMDPMMMMCLMDKKDDMLPLLMMMNGGKLFDM